MAPRSLQTDDIQAVKTSLILIGKTTDKAYAPIMNDYASRIGHYMPFEVNVVSDVSHVQVAPSDFIVLLDERGKEMSSNALASWLEKRRALGRHLVFIIGGAYGFSDELYARADEMLSLSLMTFPHQLARLIFIEQLYRACTIIRGEGYHHK